MTFFTAYLISRYKNRLSELIAIEMSALTTPNFITTIQTISYGVTLRWQWNMDGQPFSSFIVAIEPVNNVDVDTNSPKSLRTCRFLNLELFGFVWPHHAEKQNNIATFFPDCTCYLCVLIIRYCCGGEEFNE